VKSLKPDGQRWQIEFENGLSASGDLLIGADGSNSNIRPYITDQKAFFSGLTMVEGTVPNAATSTPRVHELLKGGKLLILDDELTLSVSFRGDGSLVFYTGMKSEENWATESGIDFSDRKQVQTWFKKKFKGWADIWDDLFIKANLPFVPRPQYCMPLDQSWVSKPNITMLGDAAHVMPPHSGEGVDMAMMDALELFQCLQQEANIPLAISNYESKMLERSSDLAERTLDGTASLHSEDAPAYAVETGEPGDRDAVGDLIEDSQAEAADGVEAARDAEGEEDEGTEEAPKGPQIRYS